MDKKRNDGLNPSCKKGRNIVFKAKRKAKREGDEAKCKAEEAAGTRKPK